MVNNLYLPMRSVPQSTSMIYHQTKFVFFLIKTINDYNDLQKDLNYLHAQASEWSMQFTEGKCNILLDLKSPLHQFYSLC